MKKDILYILINRQGRVKTLRGHYRDVDAYSEQVALERYSKPPGPRFRALRLKGFTLSNWHVIEV